MLEFIVLGEVPGTKISITFTGFIALTALLSGMLIARMSAKRQRIIRVSEHSPEQIAL